VATRAGRSSGGLRFFTKTETPSSFLTQERAAGHHAIIFIRPSPAHPLNQRRGTFDWSVIDFSALALSKAARRNMPPIVRKTRKKANRRSRVAGRPLHGSSPVCDGCWTRFLTGGQLPHQRMTRHKPEIHRPTAAMSKRTAAVPNATRQLCSCVRERTPSWIVGPVHCPAVGPKAIQSKATARRVTPTAITSGCGAIPASSGVVMNTKPIQAKNAPRTPSTQRGA